MPSRFVRVIDNSTGRKLAHSVPESFLRHFNLRLAKDPEARDEAPITGAEAPPSTEPAPATAPRRGRGATT